MRTVALSLLPLGHILAAAVRVALVTEAGLPPSAQYGLGRLEAELQARNVMVERSGKQPAGGADFVILAGLCSSSGPAASALRAAGAPIPGGPEALVIRRTKAGGKPAVALCGSDGRGLMYAALDTAQRLAWSENAPAPFVHVRDTSEKPYLIERAVSIYTMHRAYLESRLYDRAYWERYFDLLARSRINSFAVIFGYENGGFMAPPYPYFFDVDEFPEVRLAGITPEQQKRNAGAFRDMIRIAHERGVDVTLAIWDHIYRGGVQTGGIPEASRQSTGPTPGLVWGVTAENLSAYTKAALRKLLEVFPDIDAVQFRMHGESGLRRQEMEGFWHEVFGIVKQSRPDMRVDLRAKELPDAIIEDALQQGLRVRVTTKHWMEQMGLPFHPTHVNRQNQHDRRHGYADLLRYPQRYRVHWRLWNGGTTRLLLWGDPEYVRQFAAGARMYDGNSFEINEMLATKMLAEPHDRAPLEILNPLYRYYDYEFERYWHFYQVWGRVGYDPNTPPEVWEREFSRRFGGAAGTHLMKGLHVASRVLPRIVAASYRYSLFPTTRGWAEMTRMEDLPKYAEDEDASDIQQFMNVRDQARSIMEGTDSAMRRPTEISDWYRQTSEQILKHVQAAEQTMGDRRGNEFLSTLTDLKILAYLAKYHSQRLLAGLHYRLYKETGDLFAFDDAIQKEKAAVQAWQQVVDSAGKLYSDNLPFGVHDKGFPRHWKEELQNLHQGLKQLEEARQQARARTAASGPYIAHGPVRRAGRREGLHIRATVGSVSEIKTVQVLIAKNGDQYAPVPMRRVANGMYVADLPPLEAEGQVKYVIEAVDSAGHHSMNPAGGRAKPMVVTISDDRQPPEARLEPVTGAIPGQDLKVSARVTDPSGVRWVRLRYRHVTQFEDYETLEMTQNPATGLYEAVIPGSFITPKWDVMYFLEVLDTKGNGRMYPDLEKEAPYVVVRLQQSTPTTSGRVTGARGMRTMQAGLRPTF